MSFLEDIISFIHLFLRQTFVWALREEPMVMKDSTQGLALEAWPDLQVAFSFMPYFWIDPRYLGWFGWTVVPTLVKVWVLHITVSTKDGLRTSFRTASQCSACHQESPQQPQLTTDPHLVNNIFFRLFYLNIISSFSSPKSDEQLRQDLECLVACFFLSFFHFIEAGSEQSGFHPHERAKGNGNIFGKNSAELKDL